MPLASERKRLAQIGRDMLATLPRSRDCFYPNTRVEEILRALPSIPGVTVHFDETGDFAELTVTSSRPLAQSEIAACHYAAGELGAGITFRCPR